MQATPDYHCLPMASWYRRSLQAPVGSWVLSSSLCGRLAWDPVSECQPSWLGLHQGAIDPLLQSVGALAPRLPVRVILNSGLHRGQKSTGPFTLSGKTLTQKWVVSAQGHYWGDLAKRGEDPVGIYSGPGPQLLASYPSNHGLSCENSRWAMAV